MTEEDGAAAVRTLRPARNESSWQWGLNLARGAVLLGALTSLGVLVAGHASVALLLITACLLGAIVISGSRFGLWADPRQRLITGGLALGVIGQLVPSRNDLDLIITNAGKIILAAALVLMLRSGWAQNRDQARGPRSWTEAAVVTLSASAWLLAAMPHALLDQHGGPGRLWYFLIGPVSAVLVLVPAVLLAARLRFHRGPALLTGGLVAAALAGIAAAARAASGSPTPDIRPFLGAVIIGLGLCALGLLEPDVASLIRGSASWRIDRSWQRSAVVIAVPALAVGAGAIDGRTWTAVAAPLLLLTAIALLALRARFSSDGLLGRTSSRPVVSDARRRPLTMSELQQWCRSIEPAPGDQIDFAAVAVLSTTDLDADGNHHERLDEAVDAETASRLVDVTWGIDRLDVGAPARWEIGHDRDRFIVVRARAVVVDPDPGAESFDAMTYRLTRGFARWLSAPFRVGELSVRPEFVIGYSARTLAAGEDSLGLVQDAVWAAQEAEPGTPNRFDPDQRRLTRRRAQLSALMHDAVVDGTGLSVVFEPIVDLRNGRTIGAETLARWSPPDFGPVSPAEFIPIAERGRAMLELGQWVLTRACTAAVAQLSAQPGGEMLIGVNLAGIEVAQPDLYSRVMRTLETVGLPPQHLTLEITETVVSETIEIAGRGLRALAATGVRLSMDDFGTASSGLSRMIVLPWNSIKLDRSFVIGLDSAQSPQAALIRAVAQLSGELGFHTVAEGVEDVRCLELVTDLGCDLAQGWVFGKGRVDLSAAWADQRPIGSTF